MTAVHQFIPSYVANTAIGTHTREVARVLRSMGIRTHAYVGEARGVPSSEHSAFRSYRGPIGGEPTWLLYQLSTGSAIADALHERPEPLIVNYHNITPVDFLRTWEPLVARELAAGRDQLRRLAGRSSLAIADSSFNQAEMRDEGYQPTVVVPVLVDLAQLGAEVDRAALEALNGAKARGGGDWLFVGRIAPNKRQDRLISALGAYRALYDPKARLHLVGGSSSDAYLRALQAFAARLGLRDAVTFHGAIAQTQLVAHYRSADVFVCLSEHEGFCVPLLEAMWHRVPIVALGTTAVPETVGPAGIVLPWLGGRQPAAAFVAAAVHRLVSDSEVASRLVAAGEARAAALAIEVTSERFRKAISSVVEAA
jgi:glycosyltransferase involved in cell wall biosynthesis